MKKILLVVDGNHYSPGAFEFVRRLNEMEPVLVTGVFVPQLTYASLWSYAAVAGPESVYIPLLDEEDDEEVAKSIEQFELQCQRNDIRYRLHKDFSDFALPELKRESRFADVMMLSGELFYKEILGSNQFDYMRTALHEAECPVLIIPENKPFPESNILAYDGQEEAVFAMKQFAYLFPELAKNKTLLVYAGEKGETDFPAMEYVTELATQHYPDLTFYKLEAEPETYFAAWLAEQKNTLLVSGSFSRSVLSQAFRKSFVADIIREHHVPVFVAHK